METQLTIFLAFVFAAILMNALVTLGLYLALKKTAARLAELRSVVAKAKPVLEESAAGSAALGKWTAQLRRTMPEVEKTLDDLDVWARHGLARADSSAEQAAAKLGVWMLRSAGVVAASFYRTTAVSLGAKLLFELWLLRRRRRSDSAGPKSAA